MYVRKYAPPVALIAVLLTGCGGGTGQSGSSAEPGTARAGGDLVVAIAAAPDTLDPAYTQSRHAGAILPNFCEALYDIDSNLEIIPRLAAELPEVSADGLTYTIKLREGVTFNDGTPFDADAVKISLDRGRTDPLSAQAANLAAVQDVAVIDPQTVRLTLSAPSAPLTSILANRGGMIVSPQQLEKLGAELGNEPVCVGPFAFESRSADAINLVKSDDYYAADEVMLDSVTLQVVTQPNVRATNLRSGDIQATVELAPADIAGLQANPELSLNQVESLGYQLITINVGNSNGSGKPPYAPVDTALANPDLRKAFALSLDRETINQVVFDGQQTPSCNPIASTSPWHTEIDCTEQDVAAAKELVAASGVPTPIPVTLTIGASNDQQTKLGTVIQSMAAEAGFEVSIQAQESTAAGAAAQAGTFDAYLNSWSGRIDPDQNMSIFWSPTSVLNYSGADYPDVNALMEQARTSTDEAGRRQLYAEITQKMNDYGNYYVMFHDTLSMGVSKDVTGIEYFSDGVIRLRTAAFTTAS